jgi:hypothetical protein
MSSVQRLNTGRSAQFADTGGGGGSGLGLTFTESVFTGGAQTISSGTFVDVTGVTLAFNLTAPAAVQFLASATALSNPFVQGNYIGLAINVNGTDYAIGGPGAQAFNAAGGGILVTGGFTSGDSISGHLILNLPAGAYTVKLRALGSGFIESSANFPTKLTAVYPESIVGRVPVFEGALITRNTNQSVSPGTVVTFNAVRRNDGNLFSLGQPTRLTAQRDGWYNIGAMAQMSLNFNIDYVGFYIRKNGTTILAATRDNTNVFFGSVSAQIDTTKSVYLAQGDYIELVADPENTVDAEAVAEFSIDMWMVLFSPAFTPLAAGTFTQIASLEKTDGSFSLGNTGAVFVDFAGVNTLNFTMAQAGDALVMISGNLATTVSNPGSGRVGFMLDGVDQFPAPTEGDSVGSGTTVGGGAFQLHQGCGINGGGGSVTIIKRLTGLSAGLHTIKLRASFQSFGGRVYASATTPFRVTVLHQ